MRLSIVGGGVALLGIEEYLNWLAVGNTSKMKVLIKVSSRSRWRGLAGYNNMTIWIGRENWKFPYPLLDKYSCRYKRLAYIKVQPHLASSIQEVVGFIFLHELAHLKFHRVERNRKFRGEWRCTEFAHQHWKPMPPEMLVKAQAEDSISRQEAVVREARRLEEERQKESVPSKLFEVRKRIKVYESKIKRYQNLLKKYQQRERLYTRKMANCEEVLVQ